MGKDAKEYGINQEDFGLNIEWENFCPCRDDKTGQCFGLSYFKHLPGPGKKIICKGNCKARRDWETRQLELKKRGLEYMQFKVK